ncbi:hypothetical protein FRC01_000503 [Tulasnella sp. 417]|nr:hypothetical protein FRC01_000503 [Tulasnella sp. 417]
MDSPHQRFERIGEKQIRKAPLLPPELIYTIARQIPRKSDLLSFGLIHSSFHDVVIPYYLKFREVIMEVNNMRMWEYLVGDPLKLESVEVLRIAFNYDRFGKGIGPQPPLPENVAYTEGDPLDKIQRALQGMIRLREILWDEESWRSKPREEHQVVNKCKQRFWAVVPRLCTRVDTITLNTRAQVEDDSCWFCGPLLSELHHLQSLRAFTGELFSCDHNQSDLLVSQARTTQNSIVLAFSRLREFSLTGAELQGLPPMQLPSLVALSLLGDGFNTSEDLLRMLDCCPRIHSLHLELKNSLPLVPYEIRGDSLPSLDIVPMLTSFTGYYEDAQIIFFSPLPNGRLRRISRLKILGYSADDLFPSLVLDFEDSATGVGHDLLELRLNTGYDRNQDTGKAERLLWVTWLRTIVKFCPELRGLIIEIDAPYSEWYYLDETDDWRPTLSRLKDLAILKLPNSFWRAEACDDSRTHVLGPIDQCLQWLPHLRLFFPANDWALVIDPEGNKAVTPPKGEKLYHCGRAMERNWAFYGDLSWNDFDEEIERLLA